MDNLVVFAMGIDAIGLGSGRLVPTVAAVVGLAGVIVGAIALGRNSNGRGGAIAAGVAGLISLIVGGLHAAISAGGFGTGNGLAGAIVAIVLGLIGVVLAALAVTRGRQRERDSSREG